MLKKRIAVVTGSRAEYGLLFHLLKAIQADRELELLLIVTGMHLSGEFGLTWRQIAADGFIINRKVEMLLSADSATAVSKSVGLGVIGFTDALHDLQPDLLLVLGDRFEVFAAVSAALFLNIPIAHIHGGELTEGAVDDAIRHAITKMAHLHFTATESYRQRVIQLGEQPNRVFNVGAPGLDHVYQTPLLDRHELSLALGIEFGERNALVTFHPATLDESDAGVQFGQLLQALDGFKDLYVIFTHANADVGGSCINQMIEVYRQKKPSSTASFVSLGSVRYLSLLKQMDVVIGNSSSGLIEAPAFRIATIDIGDRQRGRLAADSVLHCEAEAQQIMSALRQVFSAEFRERLQKVQNPYGLGGASVKIKTELKRVNLQALLKKQFYDISSV